MGRRRHEAVSYDTFRQRVRRHRRTDVLVAVAALNVQLERAEFDMGPPMRFPNFVTPFALGGVARTALIAGNDHRSTPVTQADLVDMCAHYANLDEPIFRLDPGETRLRWVFNHMAYEQFGHQCSAMENVGRTLALLVDHAHAGPNAPTPAEWEAGLGVPLDLYMRLGFAMHVAALSNEGTFIMTS